MGVSFITRKIKPMFNLKPLHKGGIVSALEKARHYRLLNEPLQAESICRDILEVEPDHEEALVTMLLALTDQFDHELKKRFKKARNILARFSDPYKQDYYAGIIFERRANVHRKRHVPGSNSLAYEWYIEAMNSYEKADAMSAADNDEARLRWNTCARILNQNAELKPDTDQKTPTLLE